MTKKNINRGVVFYLIAFIVTCFVALNGNYIFSGYKIEVGQVSKVQLKATRDVENTVKTEKQKQNIIETTDKRYVIDKNITETVTNSVEDFFIVADEERSRYKEYQSSDINKNVVAPDINQPFVSEKLETLLHSSEQANVVLNCSDEEYNAFKEGAVSIITTSLTTGVKESDMERNQLYIEDQFAHITENEELNQVGISVYQTFFRANLVVDEEATQKAIDDQIAEIEPEIYLKGQTIVNDGDIVTDEQYQMLKELGFVDTSLSEKKMPIIGVIIIISCLFLVGVLFFNKLCGNENKIKKNDELLIFSVYIASLILIWLTARFPIYLSPVLGSIVLISIFYGFGSGVFYSMFITIIGLIIVSGNIEYCIFMIISGVFIALISKKILERKNVYKVALIYGVFNSILFLGLQVLFENRFNVASLSVVSLIFIQAIITIIICFGMIPIFEMLFSVLTPNKLLELSNPDNELIKKFIFEIPGTYHHSLVVANLSETAALEIGADSALVRVAAYYHDIGKLKNPFYFSENQIGENPHDNLPPEESFAIIKDHVDYGVELAKKYKLPKEIIRMIQEHHGTTLVRFFYVKAKNTSKNPDEITEDMYRYKGDKPQSKESGILMLADTCEAGVRSIVNKANGLPDIEKFVNELIKGKIDDNQLVDSGLTFGDIEKIRIAFMRVFKGMYHERVEYPKLKSQPQKEIEKIDNDNVIDNSVNDETENLEKTVETIDENVNKDDEVK